MSTEPSVPIILDSRAPNERVRDRGTGKISSTIDVNVLRFTSPSPNHTPAPNDGRNNCTRHNVDLGMR